MDRNMQSDLFANSFFESSLVETPAALPQGMSYFEEIISAAEQEWLLNEIRKLPFSPFEFRGFTGKRRVVSLGWKYDFNRTRLLPAPPIPDFIIELGNRAALAVHGKSSAFEQVLISEYQPGAGIGWHKDRPVFDEVIGVSLLAACRFRLRRKMERGWQRQAFVAAPRSAYFLSGPSRWDWEHSIPPVAALRYSITFRKLLTARSKL
jgi:alkylated DNA repair dioxygenase AlkB